MNQSKNKKIVNASKQVSDGIDFKSNLEKTIYHILRSKGIDVKYEPEQITLWNGFVPVTPFYDKETATQFKKMRRKDIKHLKGLVLKNKPIVGIRYTPDFYFKFNDIDVWIEAKGFENDVFYIKKKMFISYLDKKLMLTGQKSIYFEIYSKYQLLEALDILEKDYGTQSKRDKLGC